MTPTVLVVGSGGREHAICAALARSPRRPHVLCAPGNAGTAGPAENVPVAADDLDGLMSVAQDRAVDLVIVGPEVPLVAGLADRLVEAGIPVVGPSRAAGAARGVEGLRQGRHGPPRRADGGEPDVRGWAPSTKPAPTSTATTFPSSSRPTG